MTDQATDRAIAWEGHTPLPWAIKNGDLCAKATDSDGDDKVIAGINGRTIGNRSHTYNSQRRQGPANTALIVHRVNQGPAADAMAEALAEGSDHLSSFEGTLFEDEDNDALANVVKRMRQALAAYRGQQ